jgi:hypothetical protein
LFTSDGVAKITDWGIGKFMASVSKSKTAGIKGTLDYCAPEQFAPYEYGEVDWQTDIFQVGAMFYEMLTGVNPFAGVELAECMGKVLTYNPEPPSSHNSEIPDELDEVVIGAIEKKKEDRWDSGAVMLNELKRMIGKKETRFIKTQAVELDIPPPPEEEKISCSECTNLIGFDNKKLRCKNCKKYFCETCEEWIDKVPSYKGYKVKVDYPLCEDCYDEAVDERKRRTDAFIKKKKSSGWRKAGDDWVNSIGMKFKKIPDKNYYMGKYTVTQKEWTAIMNTTPWKNYVTNEGDDYPATFISWFECQEFVKKLNSKEGYNKYRLPTEEEWEHACRAGSTTKYCFGDDESRLGEYAWYRKNAWDVGYKGAHRVGQKKPNKWGLHDMHGNVTEWCQNWFNDDRRDRVFRGTNNGYNAHRSESAYRNGNQPSSRNSDGGVRLVRNI